MIIPWAGPDCGLSGMNEVGPEVEAKRSWVHADVMHGHNLRQEAEHVSAGCLTFSQLLFSLH